ncbi:MAG: 2-C-methyl-D-erythritol 2,4-cyclodiphosphate synthase, partial [Lachnospiraceae bacterium]|nr:2-C-methyl-D-erythritol 2,4-cyclodiphosphate synthase [Lachnospiraceae bacterium]
MGNLVSVSTIGQDSHRFGEPGGSTFIRLAGTDIPFDRPLVANSDGDVVYHAITNAVSGFTGINILGGEADKICL